MCGTRHRWMCNMLRVKFGFLFIFQAQHKPAVKKNIAKTDISALRFCGVNEEVVINPAFVIQLGDGTLPWIFSGLCSRKSLLIL